MLISNVPNSCPTPQGILVIIGGKEEKALESDSEQKDTRLEVLGTFTKLIDKEDPAIEVITTASGMPAESFDDYQKVFGNLGVKKVGHIHHNSRKEVLENDLEERLANTDAFFFTGGDQLLLTSIYGGSRILTHLKERYIHERIVIGGTSAGAMAMSTPMIYAGNKKVQQISGEIKITTGLEFLKDVCIDTHFVDRSRYVRMAQVIATNPTCIGIGIEEDTAIVVRDGFKAEVVGTGIITVIEGFTITDSNIIDFGNNEPVSIHDMKVHLLSRGQIYDIPNVNPPHK